MIRTSRTLRRLRLSCSFLALFVPGFLGFLELVSKKQVYWLVQKNSTYYFYFSLMHVFFALNMLNAWPQVINAGLVARHRTKALPRAAPVHKAEIEREKQLKERRRRKEEREKGNVNKDSKENFPFTCELRPCLFLQVMLCPSFGQLLVCRNAAFQMAVLTRCPCLWAMPLGLIVESFRMSGA